MATTNARSFLSLATIGTRRFKSAPPPPVARALSRDASGAATASAGSLDAPTPSRSPPQGLLASLYERYSVAGQRRRIELGQNFFHAARRRSEESAWYAPGHIPPTFRNKHAMLTMHVWFLHRRLIRDEGTGIAGGEGDSAVAEGSGSSSALSKDSSLLIQEELFDLLWNDARCRIRAEGVPELMVNKNLKDVQQLSFQYCTHLDHVFEEHAGDAAKRVEELAYAMWIHVLNRDHETSDDLIKRLATYAEYEFQNILFLLPERYFAEGRVGWGCLPDFAGMKDKTGKVLPFNTPAKELPEGWIQTLTDAGDAYYWDTETNKTQWEKPLH
uniref:WW domain-containing protein n=1 Tax=Odontella aurita TaxID=265563 RepID=A0A7S4JLH5_9STRA|mmetsp:Transcript_48900/g.147330  ORF Transcript_48900/g.147330 Transcript_48900/m.147330 type:complete len:329 (+) Transcript_48900:194-1180(+)|eukprot:CAMPEP_0113552456 /NCGR_PEP_ID=MMETSP0015_2-20120614/15076_1 /TAXON_ID=2838 /ORGANISM="Odontella" /LENGTH=328 /DNA_ID=CAMNT_0000453433 /DNA_START=43 /DNA_END=1029 /DNA_ORIENTATION=+ /assembly_acc=CAM_ASM_000160